jgi:DNA-binding NarL/FixJ family response regulator
MRSQVSVATPQQTAAPVAESVLTAAVFDDQPASLSGYTQLLAGDDIAVMVAEPLDIARSEERLADVGPLDIAMVATGGPGGRGLAVARHIARAGSPTPVLLLADRSVELDLAAVIANGAAGYVCRRCSTDRVVRAMRAVATGGMSVECPGDPESPAAPAYALSERERLIVAEFARGCSTEEVAERLWVSPHTVRTHIKNAQRKLDARTRSHAVAIAISLGEVTIEPPTSRP